MTTGRINQVATTRWFAQRRKLGTRTRFAGWVWNFDCVLASVSQLSGTTGPLQRPHRAPPCAEGRCRRKRPLLCQRCEIQSLFGSPPNHAIRHESLENDERTIFANHKSVQPHKGIGHPTKAGLPTDVKAKKEMQIRRPANQKFARCHLEAARGPQPERLLQSSRRIISCEKNSQAIQNHRF